MDKYVFDTDYAQNLNISFTILFLNVKEEGKTKFGRHSLKPYL
jgi:hypothetical protein